MNYAHTADSFHVPNVRQRPKKRFWLWRLFFGNPKPMPAQERRRPAANDDIQELPDFLRIDKPGRGNVRPIPGRDFPRPPKLSDYEPKVEIEPVQEPVALRPPLSPKLDAIEELKRQLRTCTYEEFMKAAEGLGFKPKQAWEWAVS